MEWGTREGGKNPKGGQSGGMQRKRIHSFRKQAGSYVPGTGRILENAPGTWLPNVLGSSLPQIPVFLISVAFLLSDSTTLADPSFSSAQNKAPRDVLTFPPQTEILYFHVRKKKDICSRIYKAKNKHETFLWRKGEEETKFSWMRIYRQRLCSPPQRTRSPQWVEVTRCRCHCPCTDRRGIE